MSAVDILNRVLHGTVNSVVQYIGIAVPYVPPGHEEAQADLATIRGEEAATAAELTEAIAALDGVPKVGVFPYWNVDLNYLDLRYLAGLAAEDLEKAIAGLEGELDSVLHQPDVHGLLGRVLEQKRAHLARLREIGKPAEPAE